MTDENPYAAPAADGETAQFQAPEPETISAIAKSTFLAWERLRVVYVGLLGALTIAISGSAIFQPDLLLPIVIGGIIANICFFAGPAIETYVRWLGYQGKWVRLLLFIGGTLLTALLAIAMLGTLLLPGQP